MATPPCRLRTLLLCAALLACSGLLLPSDALAQRQALKPKLAPEQLAVALQDGGYNILWRHASTDSFTPDANTFDVADCKTQRNLSERGRREAALVGRAFAKLGIRVSPVLSSPYCRCVETGELAFGAVEKSELLSVGDTLTVPEKDERGAMIRDLLASTPPEGSNRVMITHTGSLLYSFGLQVRPEGIAHVFRPAAYGPAVYMGMVLPEQWVTIAELEPDAAGVPVNP